MIQILEITVSNIILSRWPRGLSSRYLALSDVLGSTPVVGKSPEGKLMLLIKPRSLICSKQI